MNWGEITQKVLKETEQVNNHQFANWFRGKEYLGNYFFSAKLYLKLYNIYRHITTKDSDHFIVITGKEGWGKSTLAIQGAAVLSPEFNLGNILYGKKSFVNKVRALAMQKKECDGTYIKGQTFLMDEGNDFLFSREAMTPENKKIIRVLAKMRQLNACTIICIPRYKDLDRYIKDHRVDTLIIIEKDHKFTCYNKRAVEIITEVMYKGKQLHEIIVPHGTFFRGYFNKQFPLINDIKDNNYRTNKLDDFIEGLGEIVENIQKEDDSMYVDIKGAAKLIGLKSETIEKFVRSKRLEAKKIGRKWFISREYLKNMGGVPLNTPSKG